jgi:hypothetical protein
MNIVPSIEMIPAKYSAGILLCQEPMDGSGDFSVTRATNVATRFNAAGFIETVTSGLPRLDYYTSDGTPGCPALLVEPSGTNSILRSEEFDNFYWVKPNGNATPTTETAAPNGSFTAETYVVNNGATGNSPIVRTITLLANTIYTLSVFVKKRDYDTANIRIYTDETSFATCTFNLSTGTATGGSILNFGNGWYRVSVTLTTAATVTNSQVQLIRDAQIRDGVAGIYIWGAQLETGSVTTSYIPTTTGSVTRDADVINKTSVSGLIGQTEGTIYAEVDIQFNNRNADIIGLDSGGSANGFYLIIRSTSVIELRIRQDSTNALIFQRTGAYPVGINKIAVSYKNGDFAISLNGTTTQVDTSTITMPSVAITRASFVASINFTLAQSVRVRAAAIYKTRLPNYLLESATSQIQSYSALASSLSYSIV